MEVYELSYKMRYYETYRYAEFYCVARNEDEAKSLVARKCSNGKADNPEEFWAGDWLYILDNVSCLGAALGEVNARILSGKREAYELCGRHPQTISEYVELYPEVGNATLSDPLYQLLEEARRQIL